MTNRSSKNQAGRDVIGRDQNISASQGGVVIGGNVTGSNVVTGNNNMIGNVSNIVNVFEPIYRAVEQSSLPPEKKEDVKAEIAEVETEVKKGEEASESFLRRRLTSIQTMAPDIFDVILAAFTSPAAAVGMVVKKVAEKLKAERAASA